ncbi:MAG TPA: response regulator transcription factor [Rubrobacteraceae bacterium]|nr:response regulator transcription factor [Rubrobacteraceae bacterium]
MRDNESSNGETSETTGQIKVLIVDEQPAMRFGIRRTIEEEGMLVVGEAGDAEETLRITEETHPDVVVTDLTLGGESRMRFLRDLKSLPRAPSIVIHTAHNSEEAVFASRLSGADSFVHKGEEVARLIEAVKDTHSGKRVWFLGEDHVAPPSHADSGADDTLLTRREKEVFRLLVKRYTNAEISQTLSIGIQTTKNHVSSVLRKLGAARRSDIFHR